MENYFIKGFLKFAQYDETEVTNPSEGPENTAVTCLSDCTYAQNPEKRCMLESVAFSMDEKTGAFVCGQYMQAMDENPEEIQEDPRSPKKV